MAFKPMYDFVLVQKEENEKITKGGFIIPDVAAEAVNRGRVIAAGPGRSTKEGVTIPMVIKEGDRIMYQPGAGQPVKVEGEQYIILKEDEIYAVITD